MQQTMGFAVISHNQDGNGMKLRPVLTDVTSQIPSAGRMTAQDEEKLKKVSRTSGKMEAIRETHEKRRRENTKNGNVIQDNLQSAGDEEKDEFSGRMRGRISRRTCDEKDRKRS